MQPQFFLTVAALALALNTFAAENIKVYFSPKGGCTPAVVTAIDSAKTCIYLQAYSFTSEPIAKALVNAHKRGVRVFAVLDKSNRSAQYSSATFLKNYGVPTFIDSKHQIAHNKIIIIDEQTVVTGSFNFSKAAEESNAENLLVISDRQLALQYLGNWNEHQKHSIAYAGATSR
jgi:phosphatidylserine/phosphatidylglycerophosphate/cardiolipin synthase-like enzyme